MQVSEDTKDLNEVFLSKILSTLVTSQREATEVISLEGIKPFEVRKLDGHLYMGLPVNMDKLCEHSYLFKLLLVANKKNQIQGREAQTFQSQLPKNTDVEAFLHGFGVPIVTDVFPNFKVKSKGKFGQGLSCAVKYIVGTMKDADSSLLKLAKVKSAAEEVFKDPWGKSYPTEKRILDNIIIALKKVKITDDDVKSWVFPWGKIKEKNGIDGKIATNPLLDENEREWISYDFKNALAAASAVEPELKSDKNYLSSLTAEVRTLIKTFKPLKDFVGDLVSLRLKTLYSHRDNATLKRKNRPIGDLKNNIKRTKEFVNAFNIGRGGQVRPPYIMPYYPATDAEYQAIRLQITTWFGSITGTEMRSRAGVVSTWLTAAISD